MSSTGLLKQIRTSHWPLTIMATASVIGGLIGLFQFAIGWLGGEALKAGFSTDASPVTVIIADEPLSVPQNMIRFADQRRAGLAKRLDLVVHWPSMQGYGNTLAPAFDNVSGAAPILFLTLEKRQTGVDSTGRLINLYARFFDDDEVDPDGVPAGLIKRRLQPGHGYDSEEIFFEAGSTHPFVAICTRPDGTGIPVTCLREVHIGHDLSVTYRFRRPLLANWRGLEGAVRALVASFDATSAASD